MRLRPMYVICAVGGYLAGSGHAHRWWDVFQGRLSDIGSSGATPTQNTTPVPGPVSPADVAVIVPAGPAVHSA